MTYGVETSSALSTIGLAARGGIFDLFGTLCDTVPLGFFLEVCTVFTVIGSSGGGRRFYSF